MRALFATLALAACTPKEPVDEPVARWETLPLAERLGDEGMAVWPADTQVFNWLNAVWGYGLLSVHQASGEARFLDYGASWMTDVKARFEGAEAITFAASDEMAASGVASIVSDRAGLDLSPILDEADAYVDTRAGRLSNGAIAHWGEGNPFQTDQVWVDSLFMIGMYWLAEFDRTGDTARLDALATQLALFSDLCRDPSTDLYRHAYDDSDAVNIPADALYWARGNSWVLVAASELLSRVEKDGPTWADAQPAFASHAAAVAALQAEDGLWTTVLNDPHPGDGRNYTETSASALIVSALARGVDEGALDAATFDPVIERGVAGLVARLRDDGDKLVVEGTSIGTNPGDYDNYVDTPAMDGFVLGVGAVMRTLAEVDGRARVE
jgi:unsaturated rhamnogalacturonyl hydrolase